MKNYLENLENEMINEVKKSTTSKVLTNKTLLIDYLLKNEEDRKLIPIRVASEYFKTVNDLEPSKGDFIKKVTSIKNSLDTMISNFNDQSKIDNDVQLNGLKLERKLNRFKLVK